MFKKLINNLNNANELIISIWANSFFILLGCVFDVIMPGQSVVSKIGFIIFLLGFSVICNLIISSYILINGKIK